LTLEPEVVGGAAEGPQPAMSAVVERVMSSALFNVTGV
jgi:hypothetical protein